MQHILIADSGSTKTDWALINSQGTLLAECTTQGLNPFYQTQAAITDILREELLLPSQITIHKLFFYGAGCADTTSSLPISNALNDIFPLSEITVKSDLLGAARGVLIKQPGIACILGTGANNCYYDGQDITRNIGSLGFWMGDEGSGAYLGKQLVIAYMQQELPSDLQQAVATQFPELDRMYLLDKAYKQPFPNRFFATFSQFIGIHRTHPYLNQLIINALQLFVQKYVIKHPEANSVPIGFVGSIAWHYRDLLETVLKQHNLIIGPIIQRPMPGLIRYHSDTTL